MSLRTVSCRRARSEVSIERALDAIVGYPGLRQPCGRVGQCIDVDDVTRGNPQGRGRLRPVVAVHDGGRCGFESVRSEEHTSELQSLRHLVCRLLLENKKIQ